MFDDFLLIQKQAALIYKKFGAIDDFTFGESNLLSKYGCASFSEEMRLGADEKLFFSLSIFESKEDHDRIIKLVDADSEVNDLYTKLSKLLDVSKIIRGEFNRLV